VIGDAPGQSAGHRHDVNVLVAVVVASEGQQRVFRRKAREGLLPSRRTEPQGDAAALIGEPEVAGIEQAETAGSRIMRASRRAGGADDSAAQAPGGEATRPNAQREVRYVSRKFIFCLDPVHLPAPGVPERTNESFRGWNLHQRGL
jgi:hypothetical protein